MDKNSGKEVPDHHEGGSNEEEEKMKESYKVEAESIADEVSLNNSAPTTQFQASKKHGKKEFPSKKNGSSSSSNNSDSTEKTQEDQEDSDFVVSDEEHSANRGDIDFVALDEEPTSDQDDGDAPHEEPAADPPISDLSTLFLPSWLKTDKRGRRSIGGYAAAETLASMKASFKGLSESAIGTTSSKVDDNVSDVENDSSTNLNAEETSGNLQDQVVPFDETKEKGKNPEELGDYICVTCGKSLSTFEGFEGHISSHNESNTETTVASNHSDDVTEETLSDETCQPTGTKQMNSD